MAEEIDAIVLENRDLVFAKTLRRTNVKVLGILVAFNSSFSPAPKFPEKNFLTNSTL